MSVAAVAFASPKGEGASDSPPEEGLPEAAAFLAVLPLGPLPRCLGWEVSDLRVAPRPFPKSRASAGGPSSPGARETKGSVQPL